MKEVGRFSFSCERLNESGVLPAEAAASVLDEFQNCRACLVEPGLGYGRIEEAKELETAAVYADEERAEASCQASNIVERLPMALGRLLRD